MPKPDASQIKHLDPKIRILWALNGIAIALAMWLLASWLSQLAFPSGIFGIPRDLFTFVFFMITGVVLVPYLAWVELKYRNYSYSISPTEMMIRKGVLRVERIAIPFEKVQNVNVSRSILERLIGLATVKIETAGTNPGEAEGLIPGVGNYREVIDEILGRVEYTRAAASAKPPTDQEHISVEAELLREIGALKAEIHNLRSETDQLKQEKEDLAKTHDEHVRRLEEKANPQEKPPELREPMLEFEGERYKKPEEKKTIPRKTAKTTKKKKA